MKPRNSQVRAMASGTLSPTAALALAVVTRDHETAMALIAAGVDPWTPVDSSGGLILDLIRAGDAPMKEIIHAAMGTSDPERFAHLLDGAVDMLSP